VTPQKLGLRHRLLGQIHAHGLQPRYRPAAEPQARCRAPERKVPRRRGRAGEHVDSRLEEARWSKLACVDLVIALLLAMEDRQPTALAGGSDKGSTRRVAASRRVRR
jgi:hypothetical protein